MDWVAKGIAIGGRRDALDQAGLQASGIEAVLQLCGPEEALEYPFALSVLRLFVVDGEALPAPVLCEGVEFLREQRTLGRRVLVTCGAGISRSPTFVAAYLHEQGMDLLEAFRTLMARRPAILPHPALLRSLVEHYQLPVTAEALLVALVKARRELADGSLSKDHS